MDTESLDSTVVEMAHAIKDYYTEVRRHRFAQPDYHPMDFKCKFEDTPWYKAARKAVEFGFTASQWVDFVIFVIESDKVIQPNMLHMSRLNAERIEVYKKDILESQVRGRMSMMLDLYLAYLQAGIPMVSILTNTSFYFNPAFRYAMAAQSHLQSVMDMFQRPAREFLLKSPQWRELLLPFIPECYHGYI